MQANAHKPWSFSRKLRTLLGVYFVFLILDFTSSDELFPHFVYELLGFYTRFWDWAVPFTGKYILHLNYPITVKPNGSGDTTFNYVLQLLWIVFSVLIATIWALLDRKRPSYQQVYYWSRIIVRYFLAYMLFVYGFVKVIKLQFPFPDLYRLVQPYGDSTPMRLAWTFVGYSTGYNIFIGGAEVLAGLLLFFKRTTLFGALVAMTVMANVVAMNFAYDIPVKIFSLNLFFLAAWIAWHDKDRLINFFFLNKETHPANFSYPYQTKWKKIVQLSLKTIAIVFAFYSTMWSSLQAVSQYGDGAPKTAFYGIYEVSSFKINQQELPPLTTDSTRWKRVIINYHGRIGIFKMNDSLRRMNLAIDTPKHAFNFGEGKEAFSLRFNETTKLGDLMLNGRIGADSVQIQLKKVPLTKFKLYSTGFQWINEYPNNR